MTGQNSKLTLGFTAPTAKILIVDDLPTNLRIVKELLNPCGIKIYISLSGAKAIEMIQKERYDLVLMDQMMPEMNGMETVTRIRALSGGHAGGHAGYFSRLPIVLLTADTSEVTEETLSRSGLNGYLTKPIDTVKLFDTLVKLLPAEKINLSAPRPDKPGAGDIGSPVISIPGVDTNSGLQNSGGSPAAYYAILLEFCRDAEDRLVTITEALQSGDLRLCAILFHAIKGSAWSVGAREIGDYAAELEGTAENGDKAGLDEKINALFTGLKPLIADIREALDRQAAGNGSEYNSAALRLDALKTALVNMDIQTVNLRLREYTNLPLDSKTREKVSRIEDRILMSEYDKAIELINGFD